MPTSLNTLLNQFETESVETVVTGDLHITSTTTSATETELRLGHLKSNSSADYGAKFKAHHNFYSTHNTDLSITLGKHGEVWRSTCIDTAGQPAATTRTGFGTTTPGARMHISGTSDVSDEDCQLIIQDIDSGNGSIIPSIQFKSGTGNLARIRANDQHGLIISGSSSQGDDLVISTSGNIGISTQIPNYKLHLTANNGGINISGTQAYIRWNSGDMQIRNGGSYDMAFDTYNGLQNGTMVERMRIMSSGQVRILTDIDAEGTVANTGSLLVGGDGTGQHIAIDSNEVMSKLNSTTPGNLHFNANGGKVYMGFNTNLSLCQINADKVTISAGTDKTPDGSFNGHLQVNGAGYTGGIALDADGMWIGHNSSARTVKICTNETSRAEFSASGSSDLTLHGGTGSGYTQASIKMKINDDVRGAGIYSHNAYNDTTWFWGNPYNYEDSWRIHRKSSTSSLAVAAAHVDNKLLYLTNSGNLYVDGGYNTFSDSRLKENIVNLSLGLNFVNSLTPREFKRKGKNELYLGFIAQEVAAVLPNAENTALWSKEVEDISGPEDETENNVETQSLQYIELIAPLVKAVQELTARVTALET